MLPVSLVVKSHRGGRKLVCKGRGAAWVPATSGSLGTDISLVSLNKEARQRYDLDSMRPGTLLGTAYVRSGGPVGVQAVEWK